MGVDSTSKILAALQDVSERLKRLERIGIPQDGKTPQKGVDYFDGRDGVDGRDGKDGKDFTYDMFTPEQLEWLKGEKGDRGFPGRNGIDGRDGIDGKDGLPGPQGKQGIPGKDGRDGKDGRPGIKGKDGEDGRGIEDVYIDEKGHLIIVFTDGEKKDVGKVVGKDGANGVGFGGPSGRAGKDGKDGVSVVGSKIDDRGHLILILSDGTESDAGELPYTPTPTAEVQCSFEEYQNMKEHDPNTKYYIEG